MNIHRLDGCSPTPLASYLKALGVLRLVGEQLDPEVRGCWDGERFVLASRCTREELLSFFLESYAPTPLVSPWNKGSGFYHAGDPALTAFERSSAKRFDPIRRGIAAARQMLGALSQADSLIRNIKAESTKRGLTAAEKSAIRSDADYKARLAAAERRFKSLKDGIVASLKREWRGPHREWLDAALVADDMNASRYPALLGTGGNDGRLDFTNNFFQRLTEIFDPASPIGAPRPDTRALVVSALWRDPSVGVTRDVPVGQFDPGGAGGASLSVGVSASAALNPIDFVLALEGAVLFRLGLTKRAVATPHAKPSAPFAVPLQTAAYASASAADDSVRGEQWMPLWNRPLSLHELRRLLAEGRAQLGVRDVQAPLEFARAIGRFGTARGVDSFQRFAFVERNGQSNLAVPIGRHRVLDSVSQAISCLDDLDGWLERTRRVARARNAPASLDRAERQLAASAFDAVHDPNAPHRWQALLKCLGELEALMRMGSGLEVGPLPPLGPEWVEAADDGSPEFRLAVCFSLQGGAVGRDGRICDGVRRHWLTLDGGRFKSSGEGGQRRLVSGPDRVIDGRRFVDDAIAVVVRRLHEGGTRGPRLFPLVGARGATASMADIGAFVRGEVDVERIGSLAKPLMALDARRWAHSRVRVARVSGEPPDEGWLVLRMATAAFPLEDGRQIGSDPTLPRRLAAGNAAEAVHTALDRLRAFGVNPPIGTAAVPADVARLWAAALAFPISQRAMATLFYRLNSNPLQEIVR